MYNCGRTDDGRTPGNGYTISLPCEPEGSGELKCNTITQAYIYMYK